MIQSPNNILKIRIKGRISQLALLLFMNFGFLMTFVSTKGQSLTDKHHLFKDELRNEFLSISGQKGGSLPITYKHLESGVAKWAEGNIHLGWYIGTLALEYYLADRYSDTTFVGYSLESIKEELYFAIKAAQRLDFQGEVYFEVCDPDFSPQLNGFFIRDDAGPELVGKIPWVTEIKSDWMSLNPYDKEMSQDQAYHLFMGLKIAHHVLDYSWKVQNESVKSIVEQLILDTGFWIKRLNWTITNPVCSDGNGGEKPVDRGEDAHFFGTPIAKLMFDVSEGSVDYFPDVSPFHQFGWETMADPTGVGTNNSDNRHMACVMAAISDGWGEATQEALVGHAEVYDWWVYPVLHRFLFGGGLLEPVFELQMQLEAAPFPIVSPYPDSVAHGWGSSHRYISRSSRQRKSDLNSEGRLYSGIDFLFANILNAVVHLEASGLGEVERPQVELFPNPNQGVFRLEGEHDVVGIYNMQGQQVRFEQNDGRIELVHKVPGMYWVQSKRGGARLVISEPE